MMKRLFLTLVLSVMMGASAQAGERFDDIRIVNQKYLDGTSQGKPELIEEAFLPSLEIQWLSDEDELLRRTAPDYISRFTPGNIVDRRGRIVSIDATDKSAMAKVEIEWNNRLYTDYMLLLKVEGEWRIANKIATWKELE